MINRRVVIHRLRNNHEYQSSAGLKACAALVFAGAEFVKISLNGDI